MKRIFFIILIILGLLPGLSYGAGTVTETFTDIANSNSSIVTLTFVTDASGALSVATSTEATTFISGKMLYEITTVPHDVSPWTSLSDVSINNAQGIDILGGAGADRSATVAQRLVPLLATSTYGATMVTGALTLYIGNNAVALARGTIRLYLRR